MIDPLPHVPPALLLLAQETAQCRSWTDLRRRVRSMLRDLRDQSEVFERDSIARADDSPRSTRFDVHLDGALNLLSGKGCPAPECRLKAADRLAQSLGLIADRVWITDLLSEKFIEMRKPTNEQLDDVLHDFLVLTRLLPLIVAGIVKFRSPWTPTCSACAADFTSRLESATDEVAKTFSKHVRMERRSDGGFHAHTGACTEPSMVFSSASSGLKRIPSARSFAKRWLHEQLHSTFWIAARQRLLADQSSQTHAQAWPDCSIKTAAH